MPTLLSLMDNTLTPSSRASYRRAWNLYSQFAQQFGLSEEFPVSVANLALFLSFLVDKAYSPSTISTYVSAIGYVHKLRGAQDPTSTFLISKLLKACHKMKKPADSRLPIDKPILSKLMQAVNTTCNDLYRRLMFRAMFSLAFHAFLRIGEITVRPGQHLNPHLILRDQLVVKDAFMECKFTSYKHSQGQPFLLRITPDPASNNCPIQVMSQYLNIRGDLPGPLFQYPTGGAILRTDFSHRLKTALSFCGLSTAVFKGHSFRIGAATAAAQGGCSDSQIRQLGRWKSDAFKQYIRTSDRTSSL